MFEYQRVWAQIDLDIIASNMREIKKKINPVASFMAVVKADGYGHGAVEVSKVLLYNGADSLAVAIYDEAITLRKNNILVPILILGYTPALKLSEVVDYGLTQTVFHQEMAENLSAIAQKRGKTVKVHIKIDTGMGRLGFMPTAEAANQIAAIQKLPNLFVEGIYTHFATSDDPYDAFIFEQYEKFKQFLALLEAKNIEIPVIHASNSGAFVNYPDICFNTMRAGIILYGLAPANFLPLGDFHIAPAMSLITRISYLKELPAGTSIGYGRSYFTKRKSRIATVPVGYADGFSRVLSNKAQVIVNGEYAPLVGNICMDQFMIDVTDIPHAAENDEVILMGEAGGKKITADEIAKIQNTINYEIICSIGKRVPRVYLKNGVMLKTVSL